MMNTRVLVSGVHGVHAHKVVVPLEGVGVEVAVVGGPALGPCSERSGDGVEEGSGAPVEGTADKIGSPASWARGERGSSIEDGETDCLG